MKSIFNTAAVLVMGACIALAYEPATFDRTLSVSGRVELDVRSDLGGIILTTGSATTVRVHAVIKPVYGAADLGFTEARIRALQQSPPIEQAGDLIRIGYVKDPAALAGITMRLEIESPSMTQIRAHTTSGGIRIDGIEGPTIAESSSGRVEVSHVSTEVRVTNHSGAIVARNAGEHISAHNESGGITVLGAGGITEVETASGRIELNDVSGTIHSVTQSGHISINDASGSVVANNKSGSIAIFRLVGPVIAGTESGAIWISQLHPAAIHAHSDTGAIKVQLADVGEYAISAASISGKIRSSLENRGAQLVNSHYLKLQARNGGPLVTLQTRSSKIEID